MRNEELRMRNGGGEREDAKDSSVNSFGFLGGEARGIGFARKDRSAERIRRCCFEKISILERITIACLIAVSRDEVDILKARLIDSVEVVGIEKVYRVFAEKRTHGVGDHRIGIARRHPVNEDEIAIGKYLGKFLDIFKEIWIFGKGKRGKSGRERGKNEE